MNTNYFIVHATFSHSKEHWLSWLKQETEQIFDKSVDFEHETVWGTQEQISKLFGTERSVITKHINKIFKDNEIDQESIVQKMHNTNLGKFKPVNLYSLDVILAVGYRTNSKKAIGFRQWANRILKQYLLEGYVVNQRRLEYLEKTVKLINWS